MNTPFLDQIYAQVDFDRELVFKFFTVFTLFEYALKNSGFSFEGRSGEAQPNWEGFAYAIHSKFNDQVSPELADAASYMLKQPVKKQVLNKNTPVFIKRVRPPTMNETVWLSVLVRGVRNNLFHGGKIRYDRPRDTELIERSLVILENWAHLHPDVERALRSAQ
jgi:hypothetical protein